MVLKKVNLGEGATLPQGCLLMDEKPSVYKVTKELTGDKFIENIENINRDRVLQKPIAPQKRDDGLQVQVDLHPKNIK